MELNLSDQSHDPFFDVLRRRHPDVDLVLLPPEAPAGRHVEPHPEHDLRVAAHEVREVAEELWHAAAQAHASPVTTRLRYGERSSEVCATATASLGRGAESPDESWSNLAETLTREGWDTRELPGDLRRITALRGGLRAEVSFAERTGVLRLTVTSVPMTVGVDLARSLVRAGGR